MKMKLFMGVLFVTLAVSGVLALPARTEDAEVIGGPRSVSARGGNDDNNGFPNFEGVVDTDSGYPLLQQPAIRIGFFDDLIRRFTENFFSQSFFGRGGVNSDDNSSEVSIPSIDPKKANMTSTVKIVDGHKVEVNETVYGDENNVYRVRVVNVRPLAEGETVEETDINNIHPATQGPVEKAPTNESNESDETREPLEKKTSENEIQGNIDEQEHSICEDENIAETERTTTATIDTTMLPTTGDMNAAFVTESCLEQQEYSTTAVAEKELNGASGNGNNEFETNMSEGNNNNSKNKKNNNNGNDTVSNDNIDNVENVELEQTIDNNEDTGKEANDNLNESSSSSDVNVSDKEQKTNKNNDDVVVKAYESKSDILNILQQELTDASDGDGANSSSSSIYAKLDDEWNSLSQPSNEKNDLSNDIDVDNSLPRNLSNDIRVNYASDLPHNPDAEFINSKYIKKSPKSLPILPEMPLILQ